MTVICFAHSMTVICFAHSMIVICFAHSMIVINGIAQVEGRLSQTDAGQGFILVSKAVNVRARGGGGMQHYLVKFISSSNEQVQ